MNARDLTDILNEDDTYGGCQLYIEECLVYNQDGTIKSRTYYLGFGPVRIDLTTGEAFKIY